MTGLYRLGADRRQTIMRHRPRLEVADVVRRVMHELHVPDAAPMRLLEPLELHLQEIERFDVGDEGGLPGGMRGLEIGGGKGAAQAMARRHRVHPARRSRW